MNDTARTAHTPVLLHEVIDVLDLSPSEVVVDGTVGGGGHAEAILARLGPDARYYGIDADHNALDRVQARLGDDPRVTLLCGNYRAMDTLLAKAGCTSATRVLIDCGLSSDQLAPGGAGRGFSFQNDEPLLMTLASAPEQDAVTAEVVVNEWSEETLADIIYGFGGERQSRKIAKAMVAARTLAPITTTTALATIVENAIGRRGPTHPATRTFQAIRMAVNDELGALAEGLQKARTLLAPGGRLAVISFHSLEDGLVKRTFREWKDTGEGTILTKKPLAPAREEVLANRRARTAKLRAFQKAHP